MREGERERGRGDRGENEGGRYIAIPHLLSTHRLTSQEPPLFTYTVITVNAHASFASVHHRMPAMLDGDEAIRAWLDPAISTAKLVPLLKPYDGLAWYPVSTVVNNARHKTPECVIKIDPR